MGVAIRSALETFAFVSMLWPLCIQLSLRKTKRWWTLFRPTHNRTFSTSLGRVLCSLLAGCLLTILCGCGGSAPVDETVGGTLEIPTVPLELGAQQSTKVVAAPIPAVKAALSTAPQFTSMAVSPDGHSLASGDRSGVVLWDLSGSVSGQPLKGQPAPVTAIAFDPNNSALATAGYSFDPFNLTVSQWDLSDLATPSRETLFESQKQGMALAYTPDGKSLLIATEDEKGKGKLAFFDRETGEFDEDFGQMMAPFKLLAVSPDGTRVACGAWATISYEDRGELAIFDLTSRSEIARHTTSMGRINDSGLLSRQLRTSGVVLQSSVAMAAATGRPGGRRTQGADRLRHRRGFCSRVFDGRNFARPG